MATFSTRIVPRRMVPVDGPLLKNEQSKQLESVQVSNCVEILNQLNWLSTYSQEIFQNILNDASKTAERIKKVKDRVATLGQRLPSVEALFFDQNPEYFFKYPYTGKSWKRRDRMSANMIFKRNFAPHEVNRRRQAAFPLPDLGSMDKYMSPDEKKKFGSCIKKYSRPEFFEDEWVKKEMVRIRRMEYEKAQRKKGRKKKRAGRAKREIHLIQKKKYDQITGGKVVGKDAGTIVLEGDKQLLDIDEDEAERRRTTVGGPGRSSAIQSRQSLPPSAPNGGGRASALGGSKKPMANIPEAPAAARGGPPAPPGVARGPGPPPSPVKGGPPPAPNTGGGPPPPPPGTGGPPGGPPIPPERAVVEEPEDDEEDAGGEQEPEAMAKFRKMFGIMRNPFAVINRMGREGFTEHDFKRWIDPSYEVSGPPKQTFESEPKPKAVKKPPTAPSQDAGPPPPANPMAGLLSGIKQGVKLADPGKRKRKLLDKPEPDARTQHLDAISSGVKLKKVKRREKAPVENEAEAMENNPVLALLQRREQLAQSDSEDSDDGDWDNDDWD